MITVFNARFPYSVTEQVYSQRGHLVRQITVAACADRETANAVWRDMRLANPGTSYLTHQVC
mgnify:FL=1